MPTVTGRSIMLLFHPTEKVHLERIWHQWPSCHLLD
jgi:hypothetical protein